MKIFLTCHKQFLIWLERFLRTVYNGLITLHTPFMREFPWSMDESDFDSTDCKVLSTDANVALDTSEVIDYLANAQQYMKNP